MKRIKIAGIILTAVIVTAVGISVSVGFSDNTAI